MSKFFLQLCTNRAASAESRGTRATVERKCNNEKKGVIDWLKIN